MKTPRAIACVSSAFSSRHGATAAACPHSSLPGRRPPSVAASSPPVSPPPPAPPRPPEREPRRTVPVHGWQFHPGGSKEGGRAVDEPTASDEWTKRSGKRSRHPEREQAAAMVCACVNGLVPRPPQPPQPGEFARR